MSTEYSLCATCGRFIRNGEHTCWTTFDWRETINFGADEWQEVQGRDPEHAAEKAAESYDGEDYYLARDGGNFVTIEIRDKVTMKVTQWRCRAETVPTYHAEMIEDCHEEHEPLIDGYVAAEETDTDSEVEF